MKLHPDVTSKQVINNYPKIEARFHEIHNNFYSYENSVIINSKTKINITCPVHGSFWQSPEKHRVGGCYSCGRTLTGAKRNSTSKANFLIKADEVHNNLYTYNNTDYKTSKTKVLITCKEHGDFLQTPSNHLQGDGCPKCIGRHKSTAEFIIEARSVHGDLYDYGEVNYTKSGSKVRITCKEHGIFEQVPYSHLAGNGCPTCGGREQLTTAQFVIRAKEVHGDRFTYMNTEYVSMLQNVTLTCKVHGDFKQVPAVHLRGDNCPYCGEIEKQVHNSNKDSLVYYIKTSTPEGTPIWKVGMTADIHRRFSGHIKKEEYEVIAQSGLMSRRSAVELEQSLLAKYKEHKYTGEMLHAYSSREFFVKDIYNTNERIWDGITRTAIPN